MTEGELKATIKSLVDEIVLTESFTFDEVHTAVSILLDGGVTKSKAEMAVESALRIMPETTGKLFAIGILSTLVGKLEARGRANRN